MAIKNRFDFTQVITRVSTVLALLAGSAAASLAAYAIVPEKIQDLMPILGLKVLGVMAVGIPFLIPIATSFKQRAHGRATQVIVTTETKVEGDVTPADATRIAEASQP